MSRVFDGRALARSMQAELRDEVASRGSRVGLVLFAVTDDPAVGSYFRAVARAASEVGVDCRIDAVLVPSVDAVAARVRALGEDRSVHGIVVESPLPAAMRASAVTELIPSAKDVDGANPASIGHLLVGDRAHQPATARAVMALLESEGVPLEGADAVVVGRSTAVGRPVAALLTAANATVTLCHSRTRNLRAKIREADVLVAAAGVPRLISSDDVKPGAVVIDVGTTWHDGYLVGDVDDSVRAVASAVSPVPGGVGPVTATMVVANTVVAAHGDWDYALAGTTTTLPFARRSPSSAMASPACSSGNLADT